jgi:hypothetical protein
LTVEACGDRGETIGTRNDFKARFPAGHDASFFAVGCLVFAVPRAPSCCATFISRNVMVDFSLCLK